MRLARIAAGEHLVAMMNESRAGSNAKAKYELAWSPRHPSWRQGFAEIAQRETRLRAEPFAHWGRFIVHDIVDAGLSALERYRGCLGCIVDVQERPPCITVADQRHAASTDLFDERGIEHASVRAIERAIAQHYAFDTLGRGDDVFQIFDRIERAAKLPRRIGIERIVLRFHVTADTRIWPATKALRHHSPNPELPRRRQQMICPPGSQYVAVRESA